MEHINNIIDVVINNFDFSYIIVVNVLTYVIIKIIDILNKDRPFKAWQKRIVLLISIITISYIYILIGYDNNIKLLNSSILSPIAWSWILKPICKKLNIDYKDIGKYLD